MLRKFLRLGRDRPTKALAPDMLDHPAIRAMTPDQMADLPFPRPACS
ncbi:hypothetical protein GVY41_02385 [Frigidibacter albus]|uniref:Uncharacterized protein n=1 Tax=Frigidibacter albus TaxID=1465486 RepID=A0A6L8VCA9_9RHOB|nr:hypothetical protein [Frigidibacter albus]MZQ87945.1 hypothetical protein [Frigidibacter albus]NBE29851.1 hypothetical protein [Frigidibacter albus]GGH42386.1 hypothetical protein GCM10011341_00300 [Frigidibacter albus]